MEQKKSTTFVRSVDLNLKHTNQSKKDVLSFFLDEYRIAMVNCIDFFWDKHNLDGDYVASDLKTGKYFPYSKQVNQQSPLSARALKAAETQAMAMLNSAIKGQVKRLYRLKMLQGSKNPDVKGISNLQRKIHKTKLIKPVVPKNITAAIDTNNSLIHDQTSVSMFDMCIELKSMFKRDYKHTTPNGDNKLHLLVKTHRRYWHWYNRPHSERTNSLNINMKGVSVRFKITPSMKEEGGKVAIDQGIKTCITAVGDDQRVQQSGDDSTGVDLDAICKKLVNKTKGTKSYKRTVEQRKNYVNWCVNQLNLDPYNELVLEHVYNIGHGQRSSEYLKKFPTQQIKDKLQSTCEEEGVLFSLQTSAYRSQRCSDCGFVHSRNRKAKTFLCSSCGFTEDSDVNAAANHLVALPDIDRAAIKGINKNEGFYWNPSFDGAYTPINKAYLQSH